MGTPPFVPRGPARHGGHQRDGAQRGPASSPSLQGVAPRKPSERMRVKAEKVREREREREIGEERRR